MFRRILSTVFFAISALGGSIYPSRKEIYPYSCTNIHIHRRNIITNVNCYWLNDTKALNSIFPVLMSMEIDHFYLYDFFWKAHLLGSAGESQKVLPADWTTLFKIKEIEIVDSTLSSCFECDWKINYKNTATLSFKVTNSSSSEWICSLCDVGRGIKSPWTGCISNLKEFYFNYRKLSTFGHERAHKFESVLQPYSQS
ncbi:hypothetical protein HNY73_022396 [Argiope bruennichi]|uniref:Uncharacterized protein n=1 Tax=Argiope bruennichi TaxID=94029 RepID=A0A8T0E347_ARGBR|nr:hypothetical protein HNY73_022396 [Argiope bruennichi]